MGRYWAVLVLVAVRSFALEGEWTPEQIVRFDRQMLKGLGLELAPEDLWDPQRDAGLLSAVVSTGECSAAFISNTGLIATSHRCFFGILQEHATPDNDIIRKGFIARSKEQELPSRTVRITLPYRLTDVTLAINRVTATSIDDRARHKAIEQKENELIARCEQRKSARCSVATFDGGLQYVLVDSTEISDVRLVFAPPRAVGEFGGELDNWMWPRHTGDFAIGRAYVAPDGSSAPYSRSNVPYKPRSYFPPASQGVQAGRFVMVAGYPDLTFRSLTAAEMEERLDVFFRKRGELYHEYIGTMEETSQGNSEGTIALAARLKKLSNIYKNSQGQLAGFERGKILDNQRAAEEEVLRWVVLRDRFGRALSAREELGKLVAEQRKMSDHDLLLSEIPAGSLGLAHATAIVRSAFERQKRDADRDPAYMDRELPRLRDRLDTEQKNYYLPTEKVLLLGWLRRAMTLSPEQRIHAVSGATTMDTIREFATSLYFDTKVADREERLRMLSETPDQLRARKDAMIDFALALEPELRDLEEREQTRMGAIARLRPQWRVAVVAHAGTPVAPDANGTLRITFAKVQGYSPRDGIWYEPQTTLEGVLEKETGEEPFDSPPALLRAAKGSEKLPVNFLADADTTNGSSGSPAINGRGEFVGLNVDRVWENIASDFGYNPRVARNVNVDVRYMMWIIEKVSGGKELLRELSGKSNE